MNHNILNKIISYDKQALITDYLHNINIFTISYKHLVSSCTKYIYAHNDDEAYVKLYNTLTLSQKFNLVMDLVDDPDEAYVKLYNTLTLSQKFNLVDDPDEWPLVVKEIEEIINKYIKSDDDKAHFIKSHIEHIYNNNTVGFGTLNISYIKQEKLINKLIK